MVSTLVSSIIGASHRQARASRWYFSASGWSEDLFLRSTRQPTARTKKKRASRRVQGDEMVV